MIINSIQLENFRQYKGRQKITFPNSQEKNVTVVFGQNTCGKTTLVQSFIWCLYGNHYFEKGDILNSEIEEDMRMTPIVGNTRRVLVAVDLVHDSHRYLISREKKYSINAFGKLVNEVNFDIQEVVDGSYINLNLNDSDKDNLIEKMLPEKLSDYFFFWGERIENLSKKKNITSEVKDFLGLTNLNNMIKHLEQAGRIFDERLMLNNINDKKIKEISFKKDQKEKELGEEEKFRDEALQQFEWYKTKAEEINEKLKGSDNLVIAEKQKNLENNRKQLEKCNLDLDDEHKNFVSIFSKGAINYFSRNKSKNALDFLKEHFDTSSEGWVNVNANTIMEILKKGECICGKKITEGDDSYNHLLELQKYVSPNYIGAMVDWFKKDADRRIKESSDYYSNLQKSYKRIDNSSKEIEEIKENIRKDSEFLSETKTKDIRELFNKCENYISSRDDFNRKVGEHSAKIDILKKEIETLNNNLHKYVEAKNKNDEFLIYRKYVNQLISNAKNEYREKEMQLRTKLNNHVQDYFDRMYSGTRKIEIDDNFEMHAYTTVDGKEKELETSPGLETVKNFAFVAGLVQLAKDKVNVDSELEIIEPYPLVLDAPFSQADDAHIPAISALITEVAEQTILVVMKKDWEHAKRAMSSRIAKYYEISKITETNSTIQECTNTEE